MPARETGEAGLFTSRRWGTSASPASVHREHPRSSLPLSTMSSETIHLARLIPKIIIVKKKEKNPFVSLFAPVLMNNLFKNEFWGGLYKSFSSLRYLLNPLCSFSPVD